MYNRIAMTDAFDLGVSDCDGKKISWRTVPVAVPQIEVAVSLETCVAPTCAVHTYTQANESSSVECTYVKRDQKLMHCRRVADICVAWRFKKVKSQP